MSTEGMFSRLNGRLDDSDEVETPLTVSDLLDFPDDERAIVVSGEAGVGKTADRQRARG